MARKGTALSAEPVLQPFPCAAFTSHGCHGDQQNEHYCTLRQTCRKGRHDVLFSPTMAFTLLCQRLSTSAPLIRYPSLAAAHEEACADTHKVLQRREIPASGVCWISTQSEVLIAKCHSKASLIAWHHHCALTHLFTPHHYVSLMQNWKMVLQYSTIYPIQRLWLDVRHRQ